MADQPDEIPATGAVFTFGKSRFADNEPSHFFIKNDPVVAISCGDEHSAVICQQGRVFVFGGNAWGQLGLGHTDEVTRPSCVKWLKPHRALFVACGRAHTVFVTDTHAIYTVGQNADGQLGIGGGAESECVPQYVQLDCDDGRVRQVSAGSNHTAILTESGQVFVCGSNEQGQLGLGADVRGAPAFTELKFVENVAFLECGYYHTVFITSQGVVFVTGENESQRLGTRNMEPIIYVPEVLPIEIPIKSACCGANHTFLLSMDETKVLAFGSNEKGQLGLPKSVIDVTEPTEICMEKMFNGYQLKLVACGAMHTAFVTDNGLLYTCGESRNNKLCIEEVDNVDNSAASDQYTPKRVGAMTGFIVDNVACGGCHTLLTATRDVSNIDISAADDEPRPVQLTELPPLQKIPLAAMNRNNENENPAAGVRIPLTGDTNGNTINREDSPSMDSLEANVSGSHIVNINDLDNGNGSIHDVPDIDSDQNNSNPIRTSENVPALENLESVVPVSEDTILKEIVHKTGENCDEKHSTGELKKQIEETVRMETDILEDKTLGIPDKLMETQHSPPPKSPVVQNLLQLPEGLQMSPDISRKSGGSQKSETCSKSENETIICGSDNEKSSPVGEKLAKTQAVTPIVRSEDLITSGGQQNSDRDEAEGVSQAQFEKGRFGKIFQAIRDKENSCMGKGKVIENVVTENVNKGITNAEESVNKVEETIETEIRNHTNSRACIIL